MVAVIVTVIVAAGVTYISSFKPFDNTGVDDDYIYIKGDVVSHVCSCGLIYPAVFVYVWLIFWGLLIHGQ
ncbi:hypothetical protein D3C84_1043060 [compost metagenome]